MLIRRRCRSGIALDMSFGRLKPSAPCVWVPCDGRCL
jgi:hypothetical protein